MEWGITSLGVGMAESADDPALSRFRVAKLRIKSSKRDAGTVVGCGVEIHVTRRRFQAGAGIEFDVPKWNIVDVIRGHVQNSSMISRSSSSGRKTSCSLMHRRRACSLRAALKRKAASRRMWLKPA